MLAWLAETCDWCGTYSSNKKVVNTQSQRAKNAQHASNPGQKTNWTSSACRKKRRSISINPTDSTSLCRYSARTLLTTRHPLASYEPDATCTRHHRPSYEADAKGIASRQLNNLKLAVPKRRSLLLELDSGAGSECDAEDLDRFGKLEDVLETAAGSGFDSGNSSSEDEVEDEDRNNKASQSDGSPSSQKRRCLSSTQHVAARGKMCASNVADILFTFEVTRQLVAEDFEPCNGRRRFRRHSMHDTVSATSTSTPVERGPNVTRSTRPGTLGNLTKAHSTFDFSSPASTDINFLWPQQSSLIESESIDTESHLQLKPDVPGTDTGPVTPLPVAYSFASKPGLVLKQPLSTPVSFSEAAAKGFSSSSFDLSENVASGDVRRLAIEELEQLMDGTRSFDEARVELVRRQMLRHGIDPETGLLFEDEANMLTCL